VAATAPELGKCRGCGLQISAATANGVLRGPNHIISTIQNINLRTHVPTVKTVKTGTYYNL